MSKGVPRDASFPESAPSVSPRLAVGELIPEAPGAHAEGMDSATLVPDVLLFTDEVERSGGSGREMRVECRRGNLVRVRRGAYCLREIWESLSPEGRHVLAVRATIRRVRGPFLVAGGSAAALHGLPYASRDLQDVLLLVPYPGGGSSEPGVRRTTAAFDTAEHIVRDGIPVTTVARTVLDLARSLEFGRAVAVADRAQWRKARAPVTREELFAALGRARFPRGGRVAERVVGFSTHLSDSVGESEARAAIHRLGFEVPRLQHYWRDAEGQMESDFYWESVDIAGEFDGKVKYTRDEYTRGDPSAAVWREKRREDRLRRLTSGVVRLVTEEVRNPVLLARILTDAGVPRAHGRSYGLRFVTSDPGTPGS